MSHSQNFEKNDSFLKSVLNIWILGNLGEVSGSLKRGIINIWGSRIHQSKSWYYLGPSQASKVEFFAEIVFGQKPLTFFVKSFNLDVSLVP